jgi:hypothetical protein
LSTSIWRIARQHRHRGDQLRVGVGGELRLMPVKPMAAALAPVAHLGIVHRDQPIRRHAPLQARPVLIALDVLGQEARQQFGRSDPPRGPVVALKSA